MKTPKVLSVITGSVLVISSVSAEDGVVDLSTLFNYAIQEVPAYITRDNTPGNNPITDAGATLGRILFYDKRLSRDGTISCASCHDQSAGFSDLAPASVGVAGTTGRHAMRLVNARFSAERDFFWDERAPSLEIQTTQPIQDHIEMGFSGADGDPSLTDLMANLADIEEYRVLFAMVYGTSDITEARMQLAMAQFVRSIQSFDSKYDEGRAVRNDNQPFPNFTASENAGKQLFMAPPGPGGGAGCAACHRAPEFDIDPNSRNNGVIGSLNGGTDLTNTRSPSLRDLVGPGGSSNGAFMHDASLPTLAAVVDHYNAIPGENPNLDRRLNPPGPGAQNLGLSQTQRDDLVAFLETLSGTAVYSDPKWSDPFSAAGALDLIVLPADAVTMEWQPDGMIKLTCKVAPGLPYQLEACGDLLDWEIIESMVSGDDGVMEVMVETTPTRAFFRVTYVPPAS